MIIASPPSLRAAFRPWQARVFVLLVALQIALLWSFKYFPSQDGPNHLYSASILAHWTSPQAEPYRAYYALNPHLDPNWLSHLVLAGLMRLVPPLIAEKALLTLYLVLFASGAWFLVAALRRDGAGEGGGGGAALLVLPMTYNWPLHMGFYNYLISFALVAWVLGAWLRWRRRGRLPSAARWLGLAALILVLYFWHLVPMIMAFAGMAVMGAWIDFIERREASPAAAPIAQPPPAGRHGRRSKAGLAQRKIANQAGIPWRASLAALAAWLAAFAPALLLAAVFLTRGHAQTIKGEPLFYFSFDKVVSLLSADMPLVSFVPLEGYVVFLFTGALLLGGVGLLIQRIRARRLIRADAVLFTTVAWTAIYLVAPAAAAGGTYIYHRLSLFPLFGMALWIGAGFDSAGSAARAGRLAGALAGRVAPMLAACGALGLLAIDAGTYRTLNEMIGDYVRCASEVPVGATFFPYSLTPQGVSADGHRFSLYVAPLIHASGYIALERNAVDLSDYEGETDYFPLQFLPSADPARHGLRLQGPREALDPLGWEQATGRRLDVVLIHDGTGVIFNTPKLIPALDNLRAELRRGFNARQPGPARAVVQVYFHK